MSRFSNSGERKRWLLQFFIMCSIATMAVIIIDFSSSRLPSWAETLRGYIIGLDYSVCIGAILSPAFPRVWIRTCDQTPIVKWLVRGIFLTLGTAAGCLIAGIPIRAVLGSQYQYWASFEASFSLALFLSVVITGFVTAYEIFKARLQVSQLKLKELEVERQKAEKLAAEATLSSLESRLRPHFLFNTINSISSLIQEDPARAEKMLSQMADLLRFSLDSARERLVPLAREVEIVRSYLEIEKARFEARLRYEITIPDTLGHVPFPPLSIQTLVENSVKYAVGATRNGADIRIGGVLEEGGLLITVEDNGPGFSSFDLPAGHGLSSLRDRLTSLFHGSATLGIESQPGLTIIRLQVPVLLPERAAEEVHELAGVGQLGSE